MKKIDWFGFLMYVVMMTVVGFLIFDNIASKLIFGIGVGGALGLIFATKKPKRTE